MCKREYPEGQACCVINKNITNTQLLHTRGYYLDQHASCEVYRDQADQAAQPDLARTDAILTDERDITTRCDYYCC